MSLETGKQVSSMDSQNHVASFFRVDFTFKISMLQFWSAGRSHFQCQEGDSRALRHTGLSHLFAEKERQPLSPNCRYVTFALKMEANISKGCCPKINLHFKVDRSHLGLHDGCRSTTETLTEIAFILHRHVGGSSETRAIVQKARFVTPAFPPQTPKLECFK